MNAHHVVLVDDWGEEHLPATLATLKHELRATATISVYAISEHITTVVAATAAHNVPGVPAMPPLRGHGPPDAAHELLKIVIEAEIALEVDRVIVHLLTDPRYDAPYTTELHDHPLTDIQRDGRAVQRTPRTDDKKETMTHPSPRDGLSTGSPFSHGAGGRGVSAIVIGGAEGLGAEAVRRLHRNGVAVVIADTDANRGRALAGELGHGIAFAPTDALGDDSIRVAIGEAGRLGTMRYAVIAHRPPGVARRLVDNKGVPADLESFAGCLQQHTTGAYNSLRLIAAAIAATEPLDDGERGSIVMSASVAGYEGQLGQTAFAAAMAAIIGLTLPAARDLARSGVRVNTVASAVMDAGVVAGAPRDLKNELAAEIPFPKRLGTPADFADAAMFLLNNGYVNGHVLRLDGAHRYGPK